MKVQDGKAKLTSRVGFKGLAKWHRGPKRLFLSLFEPLLSLFGEMLNPTYHPKRANTLHDILIPTTNSTVKLSKNWLSERGFCKRGLQLKFAVDASYELQLEFASLHSRCKSGLLDDQSSFAILAKLASRNDQCGFILTTAACTVCGEGNASFCSFVYEDIRACKAGHCSPPPFAVNAPTLIFQNIRAHKAGSCSPPPFAVNAPNHAYFSEHQGPQSRQLQPFSFPLLLMHPITQVLTPTKLRAAVDAEESCFAIPSAALMAASLACLSSELYESLVARTIPNALKATMRQNKMTAGTYYNFTLSLVCLC
eukprot:1158070-Pelagomonas_calceolata.AAC.4